MSRPNETWPMGVRWWQLTCGDGLVSAVCHRSQKPLQGHSFWWQCSHLVAEHIRGRKQKGMGQEAVRSKKKSGPVRPGLVRLSWAQGGWDGSIHIGAWSREEGHTHLRPCLTLCSAWGFWRSERKATLRVATWAISFLNEVRPAPSGVSSSDYKHPPCVLITCVKTLRQRELGCDSLVCKQNKTKNQQ